MVKVNTARRDRKQKQKGKSMKEYGSQKHVRKQQELHEKCRIRKRGIHT